jgi:hypothetical protein
MAELSDAGANPISDGLRTILRRGLSAFGERDRQLLVDYFNGKRDAVRVYD